MEQMLSIKVPFDSFKINLRNLSGMMVRMPLKKVILVSFKL